MSPINSLTVASLTNLTPWWPPIISLVRAHALLFAIRMTVIDIGCGFDEAKGQASIPEAVGIDLNFESGESMVAHPVIGDVTSIPLRDKSGDFIHAHAILEHLSRADLCLDEMKRIMKPDGQGSILVPVDANSIRQVWRRFYKEWPFSLGWVLDKLIRSVTLWRIPGLLHVTQVDIKDVEKWFTVDKTKIKYNRRIHKWFVHMAPMVVLIKLDLLKTRLTVDEYAEVVIPISQLSKEKAKNVN